MLLPSLSKAKNQGSELIHTGAFNPLNKFGKKGGPIKVGQKLKDGTKASLKDVEKTLNKMNAYIYRLNRNTGLSIPQARLVGEGVYVPNLVLKTPGGSQFKDFRRVLDGIYDITKKTTALGTSLGAAGISADVMFNDSEGINNLVDWLSEDDFENKEYGGPITKYQDGTEVFQIPEYLMQQHRNELKLVESADGVLMKNPESTATGFYGQRFSEIKNLPEMKGITRDKFAKDTTLQNKIYDIRFQEGIADANNVRNSTVKNLDDLYKEYSPQIKEKGYNPMDLAGIVNLLGRQGTREFLGDHVRDKKSLSKVFPDKYGKGKKQANHTPDEYVEKMRSIRPDNLQNYNYDTYSFNPISYTQPYKEGEDRMLLNLKNRNQPSIQRPFNPEFPSRVINNTSEQEIPLSPIDLEDINRIYDKKTTKEEIGNIQHKLDSLGYNIGSAGVDSLAGDSTELALKQFALDQVNDRPAPIDVEEPGIWDNMVETFNTAKTGIKDFAEFVGFQNGGEVESYQNGTEVVIPNSENEEVVVPMQQELPHQEIVSFPTEREPYSDPKIPMWSNKDYYKNIYNTNVKESLAKQYSIWKSIFKSPDGINIEGYKNIYDIQEFFNSGEWRKGFKNVEKYRKPSHPMLGEIDPETLTFIPSERNVNTNEEIADYILQENIPVNFKKVERIPINPDGFAPGSATEFADKVVIPSGNITMKDMQEPILANGEMLMPGDEAQFDTDYVVEEKLPKAQDGLKVEGNWNDPVLDPSSNYSQIKRQKEVEDFARQVIKKEPSIFDITTQEGRDNNPLSYFPLTGDALDAMSFGEAVDKKDYETAALYGLFGAIPGAAGPIVNKVKPYVNKLKSFFKSSKIPKSFKSEIDWGKWNKDIPDNKDLMEEYKTLEALSKKEGTWMKNPDGSEFTGTPEQFIQQQSAAFKESFPNVIKDARGNVQTNYHGSPEKNILEFDDAISNAKMHESKSGLRGQHLGKGIYSTPKKSYANEYAIKEGTDGRIYELYQNANKKQDAVDKLDMLIDSKIDKVKADLKSGIISEKESMILYDEILKENEFLWSKLKDEDFKLQEGFDYFKSGLEQIVPFSNFPKSMTGNNGKFDLTNPNIYKEYGGKL